MFKGRSQKGCAGTDAIQAFGMLCFFELSVPMRARKAVRGVGMGEGTGEARMALSLRGRVEGSEDRLREILCWVNKDE